MNHPVLVKQTKTKPNASKAALCRVLHVINGEHYSGAERVQDLLAGSLRDLGYKVGFACLKPNLFPVQRRSRDNDLHEIKMKSRLDFRLVGQFAKIVRSGNYRIIHAHTPRTLVVGSLVARRCRLPLVYHVHSPVGRDSTRPWQNRINQVVETWLARRADHLICVSSSLQQYMQQLGHDPRKMTTVANGVASIAELPTRTNPSGMWTLGTTALFRPRKGTEVLLHAIASLNRNRVPVKLLAVGPFESEAYERSLLSLADELHISHLITWTGFQSNVDEYFRRMDVFVLPSLFGEGMPMVVLEAMANGTPVVAADVEGISQAIRDGRDGLIFKPGDADQLAKKIQQLVDGEDDWMTLCNSALKRQRKLFSDRSMADGVAKVYDQLLGS